MTDDGILSQEEINALLHGTDNEQEENEQKDMETDQSETDPNIKEQYLTKLEIDAIGELGNISLGNSATALSTILDQKVEITTPTVSMVKKTGLKEEFPFEHVSLQVKYIDGFDGENIFLMKAHDASIISNIMLGGTGTEVKEELSEIELSAVQEAMNQMMGSSATSMSSVFNKRVDISPPSITYEHIDKLEEVQQATQEDIFIRVSFQLKVGTLIDSEIFQLIPFKFAKELVTHLLDTEEGHKGHVEKQSSVAEAPILEEPMSNQTEQTGNQQIGAKVAKEAPVQAASFSEFSSPELSKQGKRNLNMLLDIPLTVTVELGRTKQTVEEILDLTTGSIIELDKLAGEPVDVLVNSKLIAKGEVVVIDENFGVRVTDIVSQQDRLMKLN